jgi:hypothetical protein
MYSRYTINDSDGTFLKNKYSLGSRIMAPKDNIISNMRVNMNIMNRFQGAFGDLIVKMTQDTDWMYVIDFLVLNSGLTNALICSNLHLEQLLI